MEEREIRILAKEGSFNGEPLNGNLEETSISWVILTDKHAFKLKKPKKLSFLDYSTLELRKLNCDREIDLNKRYSPIYLAVLPVRSLEGKWIMGGENGEVVEYAVQMKRLATSKKMDVMLRRDLVTAEHLAPLAKEIADFHQQAEIVKSPFRLKAAKELFNDIETVKNYLGEQFGNGSLQLIADSVRCSNQFLKDHSRRFEERIQQGFKRDLHGDLHSGNIFLYKKPILFDGIEFNSEIRQTDVLYEIAFLCMELEVFRKHELALLFKNSYNEHFPSFKNEEDERIFTYYKLLRANIRAKVHALGGQQAEELLDQNNHLQEAKRYLVKMKDYLKDLKEGE